MIKIQIANPVDIEKTLFIPETSISSIIDADDFIIINARLTFGRRVKLQGQEAQKLRAFLEQQCELELTGDFV